MVRIPEHAKLVYDGIRIKVFQWEQEQFDGSFKTFEVSFKRPGIELIIVDKDGKIILAKEEQPYVGNFINLPGGCIEDSESPIITAKKELLEEFGMISSEISLFAKFETGNSIISTCFIYLVKNPEKVREPKLEPGEKIEPLRVSFDEFMEITQGQEFRDKEFQRRMLRLTKEEKEEMREKILGNKKEQIQFV